MLLSKHCPHTGVVNFYDDTEPHLSIGSIIKCKTSVTARAGYAWRFYAVDGTKSGRALDARTAERSLRAISADMEPGVKAVRH